MSMWTKHLSKKSSHDYRKMLSSDEFMADSATEFYAIMPMELQNHFSLEQMINFSVSQRQEQMKKSRSQKKTFGRVIKKDSSDFSDVDLTEFGL